MNKKTKTTLITGLWKHSTSDNKNYFIGRIGANLYAVVIENKNKNKEKSPDYYLYFVNGSKDEISNLVEKNLVINEDFL